MNQKATMRKEKLATLRQVVLIAVLISSSWLWADKGPDAAGVTATSNTVYSFIDLVTAGGSGQVLGGTDDNVALLTLPSNLGFTFYGNTYNLICVSSNGLIYFVTTQGACSSANLGVDLNNIDLSSQATPGDQPSVAPYWTDLTFAVSGAGAVYYQVQGTAPNRTLVIEWYNAYTVAGNYPITFEAVFSEGSNQILFQYQALDPSDGGIATIGVRDTAGQTNNREIAWSYKSAVLSNNSAILFTPPAISYLVGDVYPSTGFSAGSFGRGPGTLDTNDLIATLRVVLNIGTIPPACSDLFDAMDAYPVDTTSRGGDGVVNTLDLIEQLKRILNIDTSRPTRTPKTCAAGAQPQSIRQGVRPGLRGGTQQGSLEIVEAGSAGNGWSRVALYLHATSDLHLAGMALSVHSEGVPNSAQLHFVPASRPPTISDAAVTGHLGLAWLNGWSASVGQRVLLGYVEKPAGTGPLAFNTASANATGDGHAVTIGLGAEPSGQ